MPPKKRAAAAVSAAPDPAPSRARSTRGAKTEEPPTATTRAKRGATQKAAEEPAKKRTKTSTTVAEVQEETNATVAEAPKRRGRPAKSNGPSSDVIASAPEVKAVATPRRGRSSGVQAGEVAEDAVADRTTEVLKRRGRPAKAVAEAETNVVREVNTTDTTAPKRRGRPAKAGTKTGEEPAREEAVENVVPAKRRGRPAGVNSAAEAITEAPSSEITTALKRRGRPAKAAMDSVTEAAQATSEETTAGAAEPPKRRGRPAKSTRESDAEKAPSAPTTTDRPKRGGKAVSKTAEGHSNEATAAVVNAPKRRGRPPKATTAASAEPVAGRKRDRSASSQLKDELKDAVEEPNAAKKGRGRKRTATEAAVTGPSDEPPAKKVKTTTKAAEAPGKAAKAAAGKRGRKPASASKKKESESSVVEDRPSRNDSAREAEGPSYWLMKAEPETRLENGVDVRFSIDDLKTKGGPEPWDGVRNVVATSNMKNMRKGDLAFFYHSNTKVPGIAGIMEVVEESSPDESAFDPNHYKYDPKSSRDSPKWHCVHVAYRHKFTELIPLKDLQANAKDDGPLSSMQLFKQSRLSVSKVSKSEWDFIMSIAPDFESEETEQPRAADDATKPAIASGTDLVPTVESALLGTDEVTLPTDQQLLATSNGYDEASTEDLIQTHSPKPVSKPASRAPSATPAARKPSSRASSRAASLAPNGRAASRAPSVPRSTRGASRPLSAGSGSAKAMSRDPSAPPADGGGNAVAKEVYGLGGDGEGEGGAPAGPEPSAEFGPAGPWVSPVEMALKGVVEEEGV